MTERKFGLRALSPHSMLRVYMVVVLLTAVFAIGSVLATSGRVDEHSRMASEQANAAVAASQIQADLRHPISVLFISAYSFISGDSLQTLPPELRTILLGEVLMEFEN